MAPRTSAKEDMKIPSSLKTNIGNIVHKLKAELKQSMKLTKMAKTHFRFVSKADTDIPRLMDPQRGWKEKSVKVFGSGNISMEVYTQRMGFREGEALQLTVKVSNNSTRSVTPKYLLYEKKTFSAMGHRKISITKILKEKMESIVSSGKETETKEITIPLGLPPSILNCSIIRQEYQLKIQLKVEYATNPEIKLPIVILPSSEVLAAAAGLGFEAFGPPPSQPASQAAQPPLPYGADAMHPSSTYAHGL
ncbi:arrestin domain-containing protein 3-like isoform 2-T2 [Spinachia spinachia]